VKIIMQHIQKTLFLIALVALLFAAVGSAADAPQKVAILPFQMNAPEDLHYLREGIMDMLASRLAWEGKVEIVEKQVVKEALAGHQGPLNESAARELGSNLGVDYALFGSLTVFGESVSIDAKMVALKEEKPPVTVYAQTKGLSEVIPRINDFAQEINNKIFGRGTAALAATPTQPRFSQAHPERMMGATSVPGRDEQERSQLNPYFVVPSTVAETSGFWKSQRLPLAITSMAVADVNQDGIVEILLLSPQGLHLYQQTPGSLKLIKTYEAGSEDHFLWVSTADLNHNQIPEIYVSNRRREELMSSFVLEWDGSGWLKTDEGLRYHLRTMDLPDQGTVLLGQGGSKDDPFSGGVFVLKKEGKEYRPLSALPLPKGANIYNSTLADITLDGSREVLAINFFGKLQVTSASGEKLWASTDRFAASFDYLQGADNDPTQSRPGREFREKVYLNGPILIADLNQDGRAEVIVNKNIGVLRSFVKINFFGNSELHSLSWNGLTMVENWHTPAFDGMTTAYHLADLNGDGGPELLVALVSNPGTAIWEKAKSRVVVYPIASGGKEKGQGPS
jgi:TolB-like protein